MMVLVENSSANLINTRTLEVVLGVRVQQLPAPHTEVNLETPP